MSSIAQKFSKLQLKDDLSIVHSARKGVRPSVFFTFSDSASIPEKHLAALLHMHPRTMSNYRDKGQLLNPVEGEHLLKLINLFATGENIFGTVEQFNQWLRSPNWQNGAKPLDWLNTPGGVDLILEELLKLSYGYVI